VNLASDHLAEALERIGAWRADPLIVVSCPVCRAPGLEIIDRSARPYSEWYALKCTACGLDSSVHIPLPGPLSY
jgi:hypothetical protein